VTPGRAAPALLEVDGLEAAYGQSQVLFGVSLTVRAGELVTLLGRNGMGKTTTVHTIMGLVPARAGLIRFAGRPIRGLPDYRIAQLGLGLVPEGRQIFPNLTVRENLVATAANRLGSRDPWTLERVLTLFPGLRERQRSMGSHLSGGEQQMLAIGRALMTNPRLLILDEATEGLAPRVRAEIYIVIGQLRTAGQAILVIDKHVEALTRVADRHYLMEKGRAVWTGDSAALRAAPEVLHRYLGVAGGGAARGHAPHGPAPDGAVSSSGTSG
jgi:branched-chain amino acid transport system ATP-binding protein